MTSKSNNSAAARANQSMVWIWETYIEDHLNGGATTCRKCTTWATTYEGLKEHNKRKELAAPQPCEQFNSCNDPNCDYCTSCSHQHCKECHYNQQMASQIRASESYQQVLQDYWDGTNWNPLPWAAEFYEKYDFKMYFLGGIQRTALTLNSSTLAYMASPATLNARSLSARHETSAA